MSRSVRLDPAGIRNMWSTTVFAFEKPCSLHEVGCDATFISAVTIGYISPIHSFIINDFLASKREKIATLNT